MPSTLDEHTGYPDRCLRVPAGADDANGAGSISDIIANDFISTGGVQYVTLAASDHGFHNDGDCGTWTKVG